MERDLRARLRTAVKHKGPRFIRTAQLSNDRIPQNIGRFFIQFATGSNPVIEEIRLPSNAMLPGLVPLPCAHDFAHFLFNWKFNQGMQMIGHQEKQRTIPTVLLMINARGFEYAGCKYRIC